MKIPVHAHCKLDPQDFASEVQVDIHAIDKGLDFILAHEDRAVGLARFAFARQGQHRKWRVTVFADGTSMVSHPRFVHAHFTDIRSLHNYLKCIATQGND